jgi:hypothetical protein
MRSGKEVEDANGRFQSAEIKRSVHSHVSSWCSILQGGLRTTLKIREQALLSDI